MQVRVRPSKARPLVSFVARQRDGRATQIALRARALRLWRRRGAPQRRRKLAPLMPRHHSRALRLLPTRSRSDRRARPATLLCIPAHACQLRTPGCPQRAAPHAQATHPRAVPRFFFSHGTLWEGAQGVRAREPCGPSSLLAPFLHRVGWAQRRRVRAWCGPRVVRFARGARHGARARCGEICAWSRLHAAAAWLPSAPPCELRSSATPPFRLLAHRCMQNFAPEFTSQLQGWPSGLRRCVQVAVFS